MDNSNENIFDVGSSEIMESTVASELIRREDAKLMFYSSCFKQMPIGKKDKLLSMKNVIQEEVIEYIKGNRDVSILPEEERDLVIRLNMDYKNFINSRGSEKNLLERNNHTFQINLDNIEKRIYSSFYNRISFYLLEKRENEEDIEKAKIIIEKLLSGGGIDINEGQIDG
ncbi:MAG: hypothetical protein PHW52_04050 [Candidatus Pacebacteria bacterium]|nr:hypothetical protein [Candidatus Paceibacterota bacterium]